MVEPRIIEVEAETLEEAREQVKAQTPEGLYLLSEQIISDGRPKTTKAQADTTEMAFAKAQGEIPSNAAILEKKVLSAPEQKVVKFTIEAPDEQSAKTNAEWRTKEEGRAATIRSVRLAVAGKKGFWGIGSTRNLYEVELLEPQPAVVEVTYKTKAKVVAQVGESKAYTSAENTISIQSQTTSKGDTMPDELITTDNVSKELLKSVFDAALMDVVYDNEGDILVKEQCKCLVILDKEKRRIALLTQFNFKPTARDNEKLTCVNQINKNYIIVRAFVFDRILRFTYDISLDGGITKKALVLLVKRFCSIPHIAVADCGKDIVE